jgi:hypothetical protein
MVRNTKIMGKARSAKTERSEDAGTARIVRETKAAVAAGQEILLPKAVVDRLAAGENPTRVLREPPTKKSP